MSAARTIIGHARRAGLAPDLAERLERDLVPRLDDFLARAPAGPPETAAEEAALLVGLFEVYRLCLPSLTQTFGVLADAMSNSLEDLHAIDLQDAPRRRALLPLEEAVSSIVRVGTVAATLVARHPVADLKFPGEVDLAKFSGEARTYLRGLLALLVAFDRMRDELGRLTPWAWMARHELLKSEALIIVALQEAEWGSNRTADRGLEGDHAILERVERGELRLGRRRAMNPPRPTGIALSPSVVGDALNDLRGEPA